MNEKTIQILATSDIHGYIMPTTFRNDRNEALGLAKLATIIQEKRLEGPTILIDNGDFIQGSPMTFYHQKFQAQKPNPLIQVANNLQYDAMVFGNHEFNYGLPALQSVISQSQFLWLGANILTDDGKHFTKPYIIKEIEDIRIAILGVTTHFVTKWEEPKHIHGLRFEDAFSSASYWAKWIRANEQIDVLILCYHGGFERSLETGELLETEDGENQGYRMCTEIEEVDIVISGHQHREISTTIMGKSVVQPGTKGTCLASIELKIIMDNQENIHSITHTPSLIYVTEDTTSKTSVSNIISATFEKTDVWLDEAIGIIHGNMQIEDSFLARVQEHPYIEFINRIQMEVSGASISCTAIFHDERGGLKHEVTMRDIVTNYIYANTLKVLRLTGLDILLALEQSATYFTVEAGELNVAESFLYPKAQPYNYDMWEGIEYILDISKPNGERVTKLTINNVPMKMDEEFEVVMSSYRATGAGNFDFLTSRPVVKEIQIDMTELIADYILKHPSIHATCNNNWQITF
ncbi:bifunctional metallophosphatase/5'-nucleotidase [Lysinibacillus sp. NPDC094403]|uniref:bifunctional metallophosphatase/5'-nucleotidase n=1 Tax=Lysinibacillus sp. NPDC094403 TaxID=3390581 RepID=UPI003D080DF5